MKKYGLLTVAAVLLVLAGCTKEYEEPAGSETEITLNASFADDSDTKTVVSGNAVLWEPGDEIKLFYYGASTKLTSTLSQTSGVSAFTGSFAGIISFTEGFAYEDPLVGLYPYSEDATYSSSSVTTTLPSEQEGRSGSFAKGANISVGKSSSLSMGFYNVCGGLRFSLTRTDIKKVVFEGLDDENLAGKIQITFDGNIPVVSDVVEGRKSITLTGPDGGAFEAGSWYYIVALPGALSSGFKMTFYTDSLHATYRYNSPVSIKRCTYGSLQNVDSGLKFISEEDEESSPLYRKWYLGYYLYGSACLKFNGVETIDIKKNTLTWAGQMSSTGNGQYAFSYNESNSSFTVSRSGSSTTFYIRKLTESLLVMQEGPKGPLRYWYTSVSAASNATAPDVTIADPSHAETTDINKIFSYKTSSTYSSQTPMGVYYVNGHVTTADDKVWLADPGNEPDFKYANENPSSPSLNLWKKMDVTLYPFGDPVPADVNQHSIGDCSFCSVMSSLSYLYPDFIKHIITDNGNGTYTVDMYDPQGNPVEVCVNSNFLCNSAGTIGQVTGKNYVPTWSTVLEKALMKWETLYKENSLWGIGTEIAAPVLTGDGRSFAFNPNSLWNSEWKLAVEWVLENGMISVGGFTTGGLQCGTLTTVTAHAFAFMLTTDTSGTYLFSMRNPWGITSVDGLLEIPDTRKVVSTIDMRYVYPGAAEPYLKQNIGPYVPPKFTPYEAASSVSRRLLEYTGEQGLLF